MAIQSRTRFILLTGVILLAAAIFGLILLGANGVSANNLPATTHILYVDQSATGNATGHSWADAFTDLQAALAAAETGNEIWVAAGVYKPTEDPTNVTATFQLTNSVAIYGGFAGTESERDERDWAANLTILSGDIDNNDLTDAAGVIRHTANLTGTNSYHVVTGSSVDSSAVLDGFIITAGKATGPNPHHSGGGMYLSSSQPTLANLSFIGNHAAAAGGGLHNVSGSPALTFVNFMGNSATGGGGMYNVNNSNPVLINVVFSGNSASNNGGGMHNVNNSSPSLTNVVLSGNRASNNGGGMRNVQTSNPTLTNVSFSGNWASAGGGMSINSSNPVIQNSIFWNNAGGSIQNMSGASPTIRYSLVQGCNPGGVWSSSCGTNGGNNLADTNPLFLSAPSPANAPTLEGNLRLQLGSPAINAGNNDYVTGTATDLDGNPRILDLIVDLGPYERGAYALQIFVVGQGTVIASPAAGRYPPGTLVTVTAVANPGWSFAGWSGDLDGLANPQTITIDGHKAITATFSNNPPVANAGPDQMVMVTSLVTLDGSASYDDDPNQTLDYGWSQVGGPAVDLSDSSAVMPTFTAPGSPAVLTFTLTVTDNFGLASTPDSVVITVVDDEPITGLTAANSSPTTLGQTTFFTGTISSGSHISFSWDFGDNNSGSSQLAQHVYGATGVYTATLTASNAWGSAQATTIVSVTNEAPIADAGPDQNSEVQQLVTLDGSNSSDPDGHLPLSFGWSQVGGPTVSLSDSNAVMPTFTAPTSRTVLTFTLVVTDSFGLSSDPDMVVITVREPEIAISTQANVTAATVGETITYTFALTNSGDVPLHNINPVDDLLGPLFASPIDLEAGETAAVSLAYTVIEADLPGPLVNTVVVTGTSPANNVVSDSDFAVVLLSSQPAILISKQANVTSAGMNQVITYTYTIMNVGDVTLTGITAVDDQLGPVPLPTDTLPSLAMTTGVLTYFVTQADLPGPLVNGVVVTGTPPAGSSVTSMDTVTLPLVTQPELQVQLTVYPMVARPGEIIAYTLTVTNSGDVTLTDLTAVPSPIPGSLHLPDSLAPGEVATASYNYTVQVADLSGPMTNTVTVTAVPPVGATLDVTATAVVIIEPYYLHLPVVFGQQTTPTAAGIVTPEPTGRQRISGDR